MDCQGWYAELSVNHLVTRRPSRSVPMWTYEHKSSEVPPIFPLPHTLLWRIHRYHSPLHMNIEAEFQAGRYSLLWDHHVLHLGPRVGPDISLQWKKILPPLVNMTAPFSYITFAHVSWKMLTGSRIPRYLMCWVLGQCLPVSLRFVPGGAHPENIYPF